MKNMALTAQLLEQAAKEVGDVYVNRKLEPQQPAAGHDQGIPTHEYTLAPDDDIPANPIL
ncbi:hypothetical protein D3C81_2305790 [compost metagenome]